MAKLWVLVLFLAAVVMPNALFAQQSVRNEMKRNAPPWLRDEMLKNPTFFRSKFEMDFEPFVLALSGYGVNNTIVFDGVDSLLGQMIVFPLKDGSRPVLTGISREGNIYKMSFRLMGEPLDFYISNYPNASHHGKISEIESIVFRGRKLDKPQFMQLLDSMADKYALDQRQEEVIQEARARRQAQANRQADADTGERQRALPPESNDDGDASLARYTAAIQEAVRRNWLQPANVSGQHCRIHIRQLPGGEVMDVDIDRSDCPMDEMGQNSLRSAVLKAAPLPYSGFESAFQRNMTVNIAAKER